MAIELRRSAIVGGCGERLLDDPISLPLQLITPHTPGRQSKSECRRSLPASSVCSDFRSTYDSGGQHVNNFDAIIRRVLLGMLASAALNLSGWHSSR